jgi:hypothetical protein
MDITVMRLTPFAIVLILLLLSPSAAIRAADAPKPIKVFILAGQSNMEGHGFIAADPKRNGGKGSLEYLAKDPASATRFAQLVDGKMSPLPRTATRRRSPAAPVLHAAMAISSRRRPPS